MLSMVKPFLVIGAEAVRLKTEKKSIKMIHTRIDLERFVNKTLNLRPYFNQTSFYFKLDWCLVYFVIFILSFAASDPDLHCLPMSQKWADRLIWVKMKLRLN